MADAQSAFEEGVCIPHPKLVRAGQLNEDVLAITIDHSHMIILLTFKMPGYDPLRDLTPLGGVASYYKVMAIASGLGAKTPAEFAAWLKANPARANYGIPAVGSVPQFAGLLVGKALGTPMVPVPYRGGVPLVQALLGNQVPAGFLSLTESVEHHRAGKTIVMAVSATTHWGPVVHESGYELQ